MSFYLSNKDYKEMIGIISGDTGSKKGNGGSTTYLDTELTAQEPKKQQGIVADTVDAVQMGAWKGVSDIAHGIGALTGADWLHDVGDWAAKGADENLATMSDEMKAALNQNAFDGEGQGVRNLRWWAGNLGSLIGQNLDTALTLGAGKVATIGAKQAGKLLLKKEVAEEVGKTAVEQAAKRGIPQKYWNMVGITATMSAMSGGGRYGQKRDEVMEMTNEQLAKIPQFSDEYYSIADSEEGKDKSVDEIYTMAKKSFADKVGRDAALNPTAIATDLVTNAVSGLGGGFWGLGSPAKTIKGGLLKGAAVEGGTEAIQGIGEQYALNKAEQKYFNPDKDLTDGMADNAINGAVLGAVFGSAMGGLDTHTDRIAFNNQKRTLLNHINTGNDAVDSQLRNYVDMLNNGATELSDLVSASRVQAINNAGIATAKARQVAEEALAEQQAKAKFESDFFDEEQPQQETTSTFKVDPNLERALELHSILGQFRKNDLSRANEFIDTPTIFADEQARKDYATGRAFDEVRNIAQSYGIDPKDGKAMRRWLEDYAEKAKEYTNNTQEQETIESNSQVDNAKTGNAEYQTAVGDQSPNSHNQEVDFNNITPQDLLQPINAPQSDINLADQYLSVNSSEPIQEIDANQLSSELPSSEYESAINITNQNLFNPLNQNQSIQQLEDSAPLNEIYTNGAVQDIGNSDTDIRLSLNEDENSDFAKAVEDVFGSTNTKLKAESIYLGTTPKALIESGLDDLPMFMNKQKLVKIKHEHPEMTADLLKQIPQQINNPVAVFKNTKEGSPNNSYVVLTELQGTNGNPAISAIHANKTERGLEFHRIASVYGRNESSNYLTNMVKHSEVRFVDKQKARRINHTLQLLADDTLNELFNRASVVKSDGSVNTLNPEIQHAQDIIRKTFGKAAEHIEVATFANPPKDVRHLITSDVEGWFNPKTGKVTLIADSINATKTMSKEERLQFVAWHEMAHRGINVSYKGSYDSLMQEVGKNKAISQIADAIQAQRKNTDDLAATNRAVAIEEAIAEMMAAHETGKWNELESRYGVEIKKGQRQSTKSWLAMTAQRIKDFLSKFFGVERATQFSDEDVLNLLAGIKRNMDGDNSNSSVNDNVLFSVYSDDAGKIAKALDRMGVTYSKDSSNISNSEYINVFDEQTGKEYKIRVSDHALPGYYSQADFDVAARNATTNTRGESAVAHTQGSWAVAVKQVADKFNKPLPKYVENILSKDSIKQQEQAQAEQRYREILQSHNAAIKAKQDNAHKAKLDIVKNDLAGYKAKLSQLESLGDSVEYSRSKSRKNATIKLSDGSEISVSSVYPSSDIMPASMYELKRSLRALIDEAENSDIRFSRNEELTEERYNQVKSKGETELTFKQWQQVRSPEFKDWFGDWENDPENASKVVNPKTGEPLVVYHGTNVEFTSFDKMKAGSGNDKGLRGKGFYLSPNPMTAANYGKNVIDEFVSIRNPFNPFDFKTKSDIASYLNIDEDIFSFTQDVEFKVYQSYSGTLSSAIKDAGHDGVIYLKRQEVIAFEPNQIKSATDNTGAFSKENDDIRFSRANTAQSALDLAMTGVAHSEPTVWDSLKAKDFTGFKERFNRAVGKVDEWLADSLRPVNDWIDSMHLEDQSGNTSSRDHEKRRLKDAMYTAKGKRDALNSELEQAYLKPILSKIAALSKQSKNTGHPIDELTMKRMVGNWISARYSIEKNIDLLNRDEKVMRDTKRLLDNAKQNGTSAEVRRLNDAYLKAKEQYDNRKADIYNTDYKNKGNRFKVGVAGGWSIPEAELIMSNTEKHISRSNLEYVADLVYDLNQSRLDIDRASGRYTEAEYQEYKANRHYVPLTGDPNADADVDIISGAGSNALNIARDKTLKGRTSSEAEDAIDAVWKSIGKSTTYAGFAEFKSRIDDLFETEVTLLKDKGYSDAEAREQATANLGISKRKMQGLTRSSDNVLIRKEGSDYYEYELPTQVMESLRNDNVEHANAFLKVISKPTGWYARGVTQWTVTFAPMNMMRDTWEKSEFIRVQKLYDKNNRLVDSKTMDKIGRDTIKNALADKEVWQATKRLGFGQELRDSVPAERMLKQLLKEGGVSNYGTYLDKTEVDLIKRLKKENNPMASKLEKVGKVLEGYNKMFDTVSALASYKALVDNGIDSKQAAATTLELTNFRKTGSKMRGIKALYMFSQPTVMGAANLMRYLSTRKGQIRFAAYMVAMTSLYTVLRSMDDEDEGGNKMDQLGDITRYIPIPLGEGKYFKIPVGFGMAQMAWNFSTNIVKGAVGDISMTEAGTNMFVHSLKTFSPVSPSEISAAKYPLEKAALTITPSILQPLVQNALNRSAFGGQITTNYVSRDKLKAEQSKVTTAQFWKDTAIYLNDSLGIDMHPEQIKNLFDGYGAMLGSLRELNTILVENPNREQLGRKTRTPLLNQFIGTTNEFAIQSRYYEASEEARKVKAEYESRKERKALDGWLDNDKIKMIKFSQEEESIIKQARAEKSKLTRALRSGQISAVAYENGIKRYNKEMSGVQARLLRKYRQMEGLNTH